MRRLSLIIVVCSLFSTISYSQTGAFTYSELQSAIQTRTGTVTRTPTVSRTPVVRSTPVINANGPNIPSGHITPIYINNSKTPNSYRYEKDPIYELSKEIENNMFRRPIIPNIKL
jgi:hypothetical protein